jgi:AraC-like DNA-binding protein
MVAMSLASNSAPAQGEITEIEGLQIEVMGHVGSQRGIELLAFDLTLRETETRITSSGRCFSFLSHIGSGAQMSVEGQPYQPLQPLNFVTPGVSTGTKALAATGLVCVFNDQFMTNLVDIERDLHFEKIGPLTSISSKRLTYLGQEMLREALSPGFGSALRAEAMGMQITLELAQCDGARRSDNASTTAGGLAPWQMRRLEDYVRAHLADHLTLTELAELLGMSVRHLSRVVRHAKGRSVHRWIADLRIAEARHLLAESNLPQHDVARRVGFCGAAAFSTAFRAASGFTPSDFRRLTRNFPATGVKAEP